MKKTCYLVCAGERVPLDFTPHGGDLVIAVDGGAKYLEESGKTADLFLGDFDSLGFVPQAENVIKLKAEKDETDTTAAVDEGLRRGYRNFEIYCALGGRLSHTIANINTLLYLSRRGADAKIIGENCELFVIRGKAQFEKGGYLSLLPLSGTADVIIQNCKYGGNIHLTNENGYGISNEPLEGASVEVVAGEVLAVIENA
ncbi:MAG: thiamine diphosphokinase [Clostridia bacterium]|nr:thiamine diphosphokinase [Clostridia bacterium]